MKTQLQVENHNPIPLVPLSMLRIEPGDVVYIGENHQAEETKWGRRFSPNGPTGWFQAGPNGLFVSLDTADYFWDNMDPDKSMGRRLQSGETVVVRYTSR